MSTYDLLMKGIKQTEDNTLPKSKNIDDSSPQGEEAKTTTSPMGKGRSIRKVNRSAVGIYEDQLDLLRDLQYAYKRNRKTKISIADLLDDALDAFFSRKINSEMLGDSLKEYFSKKKSPK